MSGKFKIYLVVLAGIALGLGACNDIESPPSTPTAVNNSPSPSPAASQPAVERSKDTSTGQANQQASQNSPPSDTREPESQAQSNQQASQNSPPSDTRGLESQVQRSGYKSIPLNQISSSHSLQGTEPKTIALEAFGNTESEGGARTAAVDYPQPDKAVVSITQTGVADDSVASIRYRVEFILKPSSTKTSKHWEMAWAGSQVKCRVGRGHQDWAAQNCR